MALPTAQVRTLELAALGLPPNATAAQINNRLRTVSPGTVIDNRTGLPYTRATLSDVNKGFGAVLGRIVGALGLGVAVGEVGAGAVGIPGAAASGDFGGGAAVAGGEAGAASGTGAVGGAGAGAGAATTATNVFKAAKFTSVAEFLSYMAWILNPHTLLRTVEFIFGAFVGAWGVYLLTSNVSNSQRGATARRIVHLSPAGRLVRTQQGRRMGRREGQREAARIDARQSEIRSIRES